MTKDELAVAIAEDLENGDLTGTEIALANVRALCAGHLAAGWRPIITCPTDGSEHLMKIGDDGIPFVGRWHTEESKFHAREAQRIQRILDEMK